MFFVMMVSLYTSRVVLQVLGVEDYGIYNVVGGVIAMIGIIKGILAGSSSRYITFALGRGDIKLAQIYFSVILVMYMALSLVVVIAGETFGLWFLNTQLIIPEERITAANYIYQFTILSVVNGLLAGPFSATIVAHEKMNIYAYIGIFDALYKLLIVFLLKIIPYDRLIIYGLLILVGEIIVRMIYRLYCLRNFQESHFIFVADKSLYKEVLTFSIWNMLGSASLMVKGQGINILLNLFFNPSVNAARGIAYQVNSNINHFVTNFYTAVRPQITKYYAKGDMKNLYALIYNSSKLSYFLILLFAIPIIIETPFIIYVWLGQIPEYVIPFCRLIIVISVFEGMSQPFVTAAHATGKIATFQMIVGGMTIMNIPVSYLLLTYGGEPVIVFIVSLIIAVLCFLIRILLVHNMVGLPIKGFFLTVLVPSFEVTILSLAIPMLFCIMAPPSTLTNILIILTSIISTIFFIFFIGLTHVEREKLISIIFKKIRILHRES